MFSWFLGWKRTRPDRTASLAGFASSSMRMNHWSEISGSIRSPERSQCPTSCSYGSSLRSEALGEEGVAHLLARLGDRQAGELAGQLGHAAVEADRRQLGEAVPAADLEVVQVVAGRHLERAGAEVHLHVLVGDDRHLAVDQRHDRGAADQVRVALVVGMHGDGGVGQDRLGPHRRDRQEVVGAGDPVAHLVQRVDRVLVAHLEVGDRRGARRAPVDHAVVAVDVALAVELDEHREHRGDVALVHREPLVAVVERAPEPLELAG